jgi:hypothetical protein
MTHGFHSHLLAVGAIFHFGGHLRVFVSRAACLLAATMPKRKVQSGVLNNTGFSPDPHFLSYREHKSAILPPDGIVPGFDPIA